MVGISVEIGSYLAQPDGCGFLCKSKREKWHQGACNSTKLCYEVCSHSKCFLCWAVIICEVSSCLSPQRRVLPSPVSYLPPTPRDLITEVMVWGTAAASHGYKPLRLEQRCCFDDHALSLVLRRRQDQRVCLAYAVADVVVLGSKASRFFIAFITFLFLSSLGISQFRMEELVPRGLCSVTGMCMICVVYCRARR